MPTPSITSGHAAHDRAADINMFLGAVKAMELDGAPAKRVAAAFNRTPEEFTVAMRRVMDSIEGKLPKGRS